MLLEKDGLLAGMRCDLTGDEVEGCTFSYYSVYGACVKVSGGKVTMAPEADLDMDLLESGYKGLLDRCRSSPATNATDNAIRCDLCGSVMGGDFFYWKLSFDKVMVNESKKDQTTGNIPPEVINNVMDMNACKVEVAHFIDKIRKARS